MIRFSIFGIPVEIQPFFWVVCVLLSGGLYADSTQAFMYVALFIIAAFVSIMIHELGHALSGRKMGGGHAAIVLHAFGGLAFNQGGRFTRSQRFWMIAAGPGAGFAFLAVILTGLALAFGPSNMIAYSAQVLFHYGMPMYDERLIHFVENRTNADILLRHLLWINFWWGMLNLLPVMPLDGGQMAEILIRKPRNVFFLGMCAAAAMALFAFFKLGSIYMLLLFGYLAWKNYSQMRENTWH